MAEALREKKGRKKRVRQTEGKQPQSPQKSASTIFGAEGWDVSGEGSGAETQTQTRGGVYVSPALLVSGGGSHGPRGQGPRWDNAPFHL